MPGIRSKDATYFAPLHMPAFGCSTKWKSKIDSQLAEKKRIEAEPVNLEMMLYQQQGELDIYAMRRSILANLENNTYAGHPAYWAAS